VVVVSRPAAVRGQPQPTIERMGSRDLLAALRQRVVVADGAMGTMLQAAATGELGLPATTEDDFEGHEGCNEILSITRPDVVRAVHDGYFAVGVDAVETNTFGANWANLAEYGIEHRIHELSLAGARIAQEAAQHWAARTGRPRWVIGSVGPGTKLPTLGHTTYAHLRDAYQTQVEGMLTGGIDMVLVETSQDLLQTKAALVGARRAMRALGLDALLAAQVTIEMTGTMLLGSETGAAIAALVPLGIDVLGLNCATGPQEMSEHLRTIARTAPREVVVSVMPNAGLPQLGRDGASYPLTPLELADWHDTFTASYGVGLVGGCCGTTPEHLRQVVERVGGRPVVARDPQLESGVASLYTAVPFRQDASVLMVGERTNANGSKAFRTAMLEGRLDDCVEIARAQTRDGAHLIDVCVDYVGRDGVADMREVLGRFATASTLPVMVDSTEPPVVAAALELLGGRAVINSVNFEDGDGEGSRWARVLPIAREHGAAVVALCIDEDGQARTPEHKVAVAERLIDTLVAQWGMDEGDILVDTLTFTLATGQEESRGDGAATIEAIRELSRRRPRVQTVLGLSNISFGLAPAARHVLNSVFLAECRDAGLTAAIVHAGQILPVARIPVEQREAALDLVYDRRRESEYDDPDPLTRFLTLMDGETGLGAGRDRAAELAALPLGERLERRIVDGERTGLEADLDEAMAAGQDPLAIVNTTLLAGMKTVGELFGSGQMQLPFVLQSAETMKAAVAHLEPHMTAEAGGSAAKATIVLATVKGDVHDIGKNLVDIILTNNGYDVVNLGIKQPIGAILAAAETHGADVIGMSGLLVKSTVVMKENLEEMNTRGVSTRWPVILGGAALTRTYVERDLAEVYLGEVTYARDAFEGLRLMDALVEARRSGSAPGLVELEARRAARAQERAERERRHARAARLPEPGPGETGRSEVARGVDVPVPPFWGDRVVRGIGLGDYAGWLDERALFLGQWGLRGSRGDDGPTYEELVETEGRPRLRALLERVQAEQTLEAAVAYGYFPCVSKGDDLIVLGDDRAGSGGLGSERARFSFPRQKRDRRLCISDFFRDEAEAAERGPDVVALQVVTMGQRVSEVAAGLFERNAYRDYLELHGLSVQLTEALAEYWHARVREELGIGAGDGSVVEQIKAQAYRGERYSWGYPACPDLEDQRALEPLLAMGRVGVTLSEEWQLTPEQSTSAIVLHHPEAVLFNAR